MRNEKDALEKTKAVIGFIKKNGEIPKLYPSCEKLAAEAGYPDLFKLKKT